MSDYGHEETDKLLKEMERRLRKEYQQAVDDMQGKLDDYLRRFEIKDEKWRAMVANGKKTAKEYNDWRTGQIMIGKRWEEMRDTLAEDLHNANLLARSTIDGYMPDVYALNHNYATFLVEKGTGLDTSYTLYDRQTVERIMRDNPDLLPPPGKRMLGRIAAGKDVAWQEGQIQSVTLQSILQGESIPNMAKRIAQTLGESNHKDSIRYARTATTGAENAGRLDGYKRAQDMGIPVRQTWVATLDNRTRHEHRMLDGQTVDVGEPFKVDGYEIRFPGDPQAEGFLIWNCRCTTIAQIKGFERNTTEYSLGSNGKIDGMSYEEWIDAKATSIPITHQEDVGEAMRRGYINELYGGGKGEYNGSEAGPMPQEVVTPEPEPEPQKELSIADCNSFDELRTYWGDAYGFKVNPDIDTLHFEGVKQAMAGVEAGLKTCPQAAAQVTGFSTRNAGYMCTDGKTIYFNPKYFEPKKFDGDTHYAFMAGAHEYGHCLDRLLCENLAKQQGGYGFDYFMSNTISRNIVSQAVREIKREEPNAANMTAKELRGRISSYATSDTSETVAEAFARSVTWAMDGNTRHSLGAAMCEKVTDILKERLNAL